ncbi:MAG TPA: type ISP restriction/modification enzyme [Rhodanobacter sp.]
MLALITNLSFIDSRTFDGFRQIVAQEFNEIRIVDLGGDVRANPKLSGTKHNVFGIQTGVAISFLVKRRSATRSVKGGKGTKGEHACRIFYTRRPEFETAEEKLSWLGQSRLRELATEEIRPDAKGNWINLTSNDFDELLPIASKAVKAVKAAKKPGQEKAIFKLFSLGVVTNRDEWVYGESEAEVEKKVRHPIATYNAERVSLGAKQNQRSQEIKWTRAVKRDLANSVEYSYSDGSIVRASYRPFVRRWLYSNRRLNEMAYRTPELFGDGTQPNPCIVFTDPTAQKPWLAMAVDRLPDLHYVGAAAGSLCFTLETLNAAGERADNITDWALKQFKDRYKAEPSPQPSPGGRGSKAKSAAITKQAIFHYVYAVLHDPLYREKYAQNLKREFPRIPFYEDFWQWAAWGEQLMALHLGYETVGPWPLIRTDIPDEKARKNGGTPKAMLKADKDTGRIALDTETTLAGVPAEAWTYKLGNRSALEWILDQYKEKKPKDLTIRAKFDSYRFADYKGSVIDLLQRVTRVSVETQRIVDAMRDLPRQ